MVVTSNKKIAKAILAGNFQKEIADRKKQGYKVENGAIIPKNYGTNTDNLAAFRLKAFILPEKVGGNYEVSKSFNELDLAGKNTKLPALSVVGNKIKANGKDFHMKGVSLPEAGNDFADYSGIQYCERGLSQFTGLNVVRVPCQPTYMEGTYGVSDYIEYFVDPIVEWCEQNSVYCIIDYHAITDWNTTSIDTKVKAFWDVVAPRYKDLPHVLFELFNEPVGPTNGDDTWSDFKPTVQGWVDYVRDIALDNVILVPTPNYDQYVNQASLSPLTGSNLVYVEHRYPGHMPGGSRLDYKGDAVSDATLAAKTSWAQGRFGDANTRVPVFVSEWGYDLNDKGFYLLNAKTRESFGQPLADYMNANKVHWTSWNLSHLSAPRMITNEDDFALTDFGALVKLSLSL